MPQPELWAPLRPTSITWSYTIDPHQPEAPSTLTVTTTDGDSTKDLYARVFIDPEVTHEAVGHLLQRSWDSWLFGHYGAATEALRITGAEWKRRAHTTRRGF